MLRKSELKMDSSEFQTLGKVIRDELTAGDIRCSLEYGLVSDRGCEW